MTDPAETPPAAPQRRPRPRRRQRQTATIVAAAVAVVAAALLVVVLSQRDSGKGSAAPPTTTASTTTTTAAAGLPPGIDGHIPGGDYGPFCAEARREIPARTTTPTPEQLSATYAKLDFAKLIPIAPEGLKQPLSTLQATRDDIARLIAQVHSFSDVQPADLPAGFLQAFTTLTLAYDARCKPATAAH